MLERESDRGVCLLPLVVLDQLVPNVHIGLGRDLARRHQSLTQFPHAELLHSESCGHPFAQIAHWAVRRSGRWMHSQMIAEKAALVDGCCGAEQL